MSGKRRFARSMAVLCLAWMCISPGDRNAAMASASASRLSYAEQRASWASVQLIGISLGVATEVAARAVADSGTAVSKEEITLRQLVEEQAGFSLDTVDLIIYQYFPVHDRLRGYVSEPRSSRIDDAQRIGEFIRAMAFFKAIPYEIPLVTGTGRVISMMSPESKKKSFTAKFCLIQPMFGGLRVDVGMKSFYFPYQPIRSSHLYLDEAFISLADMIR